MTYKPLPPKRTPEQIRHLAEEWLAGRVYHSDAVQVNVIHLVFVPIGFGGLNGYSKKQLTRILVLAIAGEDHQIPGRGINGYPMFTACRVWRRADAEFAQGLRDKMKAAMDAVDG
jgi:hypothetical protein